MEQLVVLSVDLVALAAQRGLVAQEKGAVFRSMGSVAVGTAAVRDRFMDYGTAIDHAIVTFLTQAFGRSRQKFGTI
jgi:hypothetical protein